MIELPFEFWIILAKGVVILAAAWLVSLVLRNSAPLMECYLWRCAFLVLLILPVLSLQLTWPGISIQQQTSELVNSVRAEKVSFPLEMPPATEQTETQILTAPARQLPLTSILSAIWLAGFGWLLIRYGIALGMRFRTCRQSQNLNESLVAECSRALNFRGRVDLRTHQDSTTPMGWGFRNATILVPNEFSEWTTDAKRHVILHELSHIKRQDSLFRLLAEFTRCFYWMNPLVWVALGRLRKSEEMMTDSHVISAGGNRAGYAELLLEHAKQNSARIRLFDSVTAGMARSNSVSKRIEWILSDRKKVMPGLRKWVPMASIIGILAIVLGGVQVITVEANQSNQSKPPAPDVNSADLFTKLYRADPAVFAAKNGDEHRSAVTVIWGDRKLPPGWTAVFNPSNLQLIVRTTAVEHDRIKGAVLLPDVAEVRVEIMVFEVVRDVASQLTRKQKNEDAYEELKKKLKAGTSVQFLSRLDLQVVTPRPQTATISGAGETEVTATVGDVQEGTAELALEVSHLYQDGKTKREFSQEKKIPAGAMSLIGITEGMDSQHRLAVFARIRK